MLLFVNQKFTLADRIFFNIMKKREFLGDRLATKMDSAIRGIKPIWNIIFGENSFLVMHQKDLDILNDRWVTF